MDANRNLVRGSIYYAHFKDEETKVQRPGLVNETAGLNTGPLTCGQEILRDFSYLPSDLFFLKSPRACQALKVDILGSNPGFAIYWLGDL